MFPDSKFIFFDESGHMDFSMKSSRFAVVVALYIPQAADSLMQDYWKLRHELYITPPSGGKQQDRYTNYRFHAANDPQIVRDAVFSLLENHLVSLKVHAVVLEKRDVFPELQSVEWSFEKLYHFAFRSICSYSDWLVDVQGVNLIIDDNGTTRLRQATIGGIRRAEKICGRITRSTIHHVSSTGHPFLQLADYFGWAMFRKYESEDERSYEIIKEAVENEWVLFKK